MLNVYMSTRQTSPTDSRPSLLLLPFIFTPIILLFLCPRNPVGGPCAGDARQYKICNTKVFFLLHCVKLTFTCKYFRTMGSVCSQWRGVGTVVGRGGYITTELSKGVIWNFTDTLTQVEAPAAADRQQTCCCVGSML